MAIGNPRPAGNPIPGPSNSPGPLIRVPRKSAYARSSRGLGLFRFAGDAMLRAKLSDTKQCPSCETTALANTQQNTPMMLLTAQLRGEVCTMTPM